MTLYEWFAWRLREPDRIAVSFCNESMTYAELDARAGRIAGALRRRGARPDVLVGCCVPRGAGMVAAILGIARSGAAYVPIDPSYPQRRIDFLLRDSGAKLVVTTSALASSLTHYGVALVRIDALDDEDAIDLPDDVTPSSLAYVIYTSGSTGTPKGVAVEHRNVVRLFEQTDRWFGFNSADVWTLSHSISFDFSVWELWGALLYGGRLVVVPQETARAPGLLSRLLERERVTILSQTPSAFRQLVAVLDGSETLALRHVVFGGERLDPLMLAPWIERFGDERPWLANMYGITETTVHATYRRITRGDLRPSAGSPIGEPIPDLHIDLLDASFRQVADGMPGEIYVSGGGLARGYLHQPALTSERFVMRGDGVRRYRSGDLAIRWRGELFYLGRADDQLKVRGFRIEPREIEACLAAHPAVAEAAVVARDYGEGDVRLIAWIAPRAAADGALLDELAARAAAELPPHMQPSRIRLIDRMPLTDHGKTDRAALRAIDDEPASSVLPLTGEAMTPAEGAVLRVATEILDVAPLRLDDDFFNFGATSLALTRIILRVNQLFGLSLNGSELEDATAASLAACVNARLQPLHPTVGRA